VEVERKERFSNILQGDYYKQGMEDGCSFFVDYTK
jgi:hypothetical protein